MDNAPACNGRLWTTITFAVAGSVAVTAVGEYLSGVRGPVLMLDIALGLAGCFLVRLMQRRPVTTALGLAVLAALASTGTPAASIGVLYTARRRPFLSAAGVGVAGIAAQLVRYVWRPTTGVSFGWWVVLVVAANAALVGWGALAQARHALIESLQDRAQRAEAEQGRRIAEARAAERSGIAREMHDVLAHRLSLLATYAGALEYRPDVPPEQLSQAAGVIRDSAHQALDELRDVISLLRDDTTTGPEDLAPPVPALVDLPGLVEESRAVGTPVEVAARLPDPAAVPGTTGRTAYRVVQEALTNARKHAPGQPVSIALDGEPGERLVIDVRNALPRDPTALSVIPGAGTGLVGLTERVRLAGGQLDHQASAGEFRLHAWLPWPA